MTDGRGSSFFIVISRAFTSRAFISQDVRLPRAPPGVVAPRGAGAADESGGARMDFRNGAGAGREGKEGTLDLWVRPLGDAVGGFATAFDISVL